MRFIMFAKRTRDHWKKVIAKNFTQRRNILTRNVASFHVLNVKKPIVVNVIEWKLSMKLTSSYEMCYRTKKVESVKKCLVWIQSMVLFATYNRFWKLSMDQIITFTPVNNLLFVCVLVLVL